jgi:exodeoxyribonuclease V alpha subunit
VADEAPEEQPLDHVTGVIERVTYHNDETGFCVLRVRVRGRAVPVTVVGTVPAVSEGEWLDARGRWTIDSRHGQQLRAVTLRTTQPTTPLGIETYLSSSAVRGVGPALAARLVQAFGADVFRVIEEEPERLRTVDGIGPGRQAMITASWREQKAVREIMVFLHSHGVSAARAFRIHKTYGEQAIETVQHDPYCLARDIRGIGFLSADRIAERLGIDRHSELRARAGLEWVLQELTENGHCAFPQGDLLERSAGMLEIPVPIVAAALAHAIGERRLVRRDVEGGQPLVYLAALDAAERGLASNLLALARGRHPCPKVDLDAAVRWVEAKTGIVLAQAQREALALATCSKVLVVTGGPGVGKTTLVDTIVRILAAKRLRLGLCAPTGRAAKRLAEATGREAKTIHRLLAVDPASGAFRHHPDNPLELDVLIADETSMIDLPLAHHLVRAVPRHAALILVGDVDQLPSVGPGCVLRDVIESGVVPVCRLTEVFRQAAASHIIANAHRVNRGLRPERSARDEEAGSDFFVIEQDDPARALELLVKLVTTSIPRRFSLRSLDDIQVLTPMQRGELGARNLNQVLQRALNPEGLAIERFGWTFRVGDKVMQVENDYDRDVFNGDIGRIAAIDAGVRVVTVRFDERDVAYTFDELDELSLAYAVTIHKAQGSEYPAVVIPIHTQHYPLLQRNLVYTGITRGRRLVVLIAAPKALAIAVRRVDAGARYTTLAERLRAAAARYPDARSLPRVAET